MKKLLSFTAAFLLLAVLANCGGGGGGTSTEDCVVGSSEIGKCQI